MTEQTTTEKEHETRNEGIERFNKIMFYAAPALGFVFAFTLAFSSAWYLAFLAGIISGIFYTEMKKGVVAGLIAVGLGWTLYVIIKVSISNIETLLNQVGGIILGSDGMGWLFIIAVILFGFIFGALGGTFGSGIRKLMQPEPETTQ
jgi:hypothetical protein